MRTFSDPAATNYGLNDQPRVAQVTPTTDTDGLGHRPTRTDVCGAPYEPSESTGASSS